MHGPRAKSLAQSPQLRPVYPSFFANGGQFPFKYMFPKVVPRQSLAGASACTVRTDSGAAERARTFKVTSRGALNEAAIQRALDGLDGTSGEATPPPAHIVTKPIGRRRRATCISLTSAPPAHHAELIDNFPTTAEAEKPSRRNPLEEV